MEIATLLTNEFPLGAEQKPAAHHAEEETRQSLWAELGLTEPEFLDESLAPEIDEALLRRGRSNRVRQPGLACVSCSLRKEARRSAADPLTDRRVRIFSPRRQHWSDHFRWEKTIVVPLTATGRATVAALQMNRPLIVAIHAEEGYRGRHPPG